MGKQRTTPDPRGRRFGRFVLQLRKARGLTQEALAERSGLASDTIRRMEAELLGRIVTDAGSIRRAAKLLDVPRSTLGARMRRARS